MKPEITPIKGGRKGRPPKYENVEEIKGLINEYFTECNGKVLVDDKNKPIINPKTHKPILYDRKPPTVTGLALALGFNSRQSLLNYQAKPAFMDTITRAKTMIEEYCEKRLFDRDGVNGAKFNLINNFNGWKEKQEMKMEHDLVKFEGESELED